MIIVDHIFAHLLSNTEYFNLVLPHLEQEFFSFDQPKTTLLTEIINYRDKYSKVPSFDDLILRVSVNPDLNDVEKTKVVSEIESIKKVPANVLNIDNIIDETETWIQTRSMQIAVLKAAEILQQNKPTGGIPDMMKEALAVGFNRNLGFEYITEWEKMYEYYTSEAARIPFGHVDMDRLFNGGLRKKSLSLVAGRQNIGKTLWLCNMASLILRQGYNVVYITGEVAEEEIYARIDSCTIDIEMDSLNKDLDKELYKSKVRDFLSQNDRGRLFIKEYPTGAASKAHIEAYLKELEIKHKFIPDVIVIDYIGLFKSQSLPPSAGIDGYLSLKKVSEEFRALAIETNTAILSATQTNRSGAKNTAKEMDNTGLADSYALAFVADFILGLIQSETMRSENYYLAKVLKTRFGKNNDEYRTVGVDYNFGKLFEMEHQEISETQKQQIQAIDVKTKDAEVENGILDDEGTERVFFFDE